MTRESLFFMKDLQALAAPFTFALPGAAELKAVARPLVERVRRERPVRVELTDADRGGFVERLRGMTAFEAELLRRDGLLEYLAPEENLGEVGAFATLSPARAASAHARGAIDLDHLAAAAEGFTGESAVGHPGRGGRRAGRLGPRAHRAGELSPATSRA